jgi:type VI secretion system secreted protein Hcp
MWTADWKLSALSRRDGIAQIQVRAWSVALKSAQCASCNCCKKHEKTGAFNDRGRERSWHARCDGRDADVRRLTERRASMPHEMYATMKGKKQGDIHKGASKQDSIGQFAKSDTANQDKITVFAHNAGTVVPRDMTTGVATGTRSHTPVTITKLLDRTSPQIAQAIATNEVFDEVVIEHYRNDPGGMAKPQMYYKVTYTNCTLVETRQYTPLTINPNNGYFGNMEDVSFTFKGVKHEHTASSTSGEDNA